MYLRVCLGAFGISSLFIFLLDNFFAVKSDTAATETKISQFVIFFSTEINISLAVFTFIDSISLFCEYLQGPFTIITFAP